jgi:CheY-like chemotaxis protein
MDPVNSPRTRLRILVAEDEPLAAMVVEEILLEHGHEVMLVPDGAAAIEMARTQPFDVLVTDLAMPRLPGWELIPHLRAGRPNLPVVVMTGFLPPGVDSVLEHCGPGPMVLLRKPFDLEALVTAVAQVANGRWSGNDNARSNEVKVELGRGRIPERQD